jgi:hypothetical protein
MMTAHPSPGEVMMLLTDKLLRTAVLDADPGDALPEAFVSPPATTRTVPHTVAIPAPLAVPVPRVLPRRAP